MVSAVAIVLLIYVFFQFNNALNQSPAYQNLQPSQQSTLQTLQSYGGQALVSVDPAIIEAVLAVLGAVGILSAIIAKIKR